MPYLICDKCNVYYEIDSAQEMDKFDSCECGNELQYYETIEEYMNEDVTDSNEVDDSAEDYTENNKGIFHSINKKNLVTLQMEMLKEQKEKEKNEHLKRDLKYRIRHAIANNKEKEIENSEIHDDYEPIVSKEFKDKDNLKKRKKILLKEIELLKESKKK